jgi:hypothetical protein
VLPNARLRTPASFPNLFPGSVLTIDGDGNFAAGGSPTIGEIRYKFSPTTIPKLVMNGGEIDCSVGGGTGTQCAIYGEIDIHSNTPFYNDSANDAGYSIYSLLTGAGQIEYHDLGWSLSNGNTMNVACNTNTFMGTWNVVQGTLLGTGSNALGTNSIIVGATGALETTYDLSNPSASLTLNGQMLLHQNDTFRAVRIAGASLFAGTYSFAYLNTYYPSSFPASWPLQSGSSVTSGSGSLTVLSGPTTPAISFQGIAATNVVLNWSNAGLGILLEATNVSGPWWPVAGATPPFTNAMPPPSPQMFFRLRAQ